MAVNDDALPDSIDGLLSTTTGDEVAIRAVLTDRRDPDGVAVYVCALMTTVDLIAGIEFPVFPPRSRVEVTIGAVDLPAEPLTEHLIGDRRCPSCGTALNAALPTDPTQRRPPSPGAITICVECAAPCALDDHGGLRHLTDAELLRVSADPDFARIRDAIITAIGGRG